MTDEASSTEEAPAYPKDAWIPHVVPFIAWMFIFQMLGDPAGWKYALRTVVCIGVFIYFKPWRWYTKLDLKHVPAALAVGVFVFAFWIAPETKWASQFPEFQKIYLTFFTQDVGKVINFGIGMTVYGQGGAGSLALPVLLTVVVLAFRPWQLRGPANKPPVILLSVLGILLAGVWLLFLTPIPGGLPFLAKWVDGLPTEMPWVVMEPLEEKDFVYKPSVCGWHFTAMRIIGSAFVISFIEEFFWRGWMYRWVVHEKFMSVDIGKLKWSALIIASVFFAMVHHRWLAALLCGICYGLLMIKSRDIWAGGVAHACTNFLLGVYVVWADAYQFWS